MKHKNLILVIICIILTLTIGALILLIKNGIILSNMTMAYELKSYSNYQAHNSKILKDYDDYLDSGITEVKLTKNDFNNNSYIIVNVEYDSCGDKIYPPNKVEVFSESVKVTIPYKTKCGSCATLYKTYLVKSEKITSDKRIVPFYQALNHRNCPGDIVVKKPVIYLYPEEDTQVTIKVLKDKDLLTSYPKYDKEWKVQADKDGKISYKDKEYYSLYYEAKIDTITPHKEGFVVEDKDLISFLEEKLDILGLNYKERQEFIIYWLPILQNNKYNYIYFETNVNDIYPISVNPKPDTEIRILMEYLPLKDKMQVPEQELCKVQRQGFTLVEWGGTRIYNK